RVPRATDGREGYPQVCEGSRGCARVGEAARTERGTRPRGLRARGAVHPRTRVRALPARAGGAVRPAGGEGRAAGSPAAGPGEVVLQVDRGWRSLPARTPRPQPATSAYRLLAQDPQPEESNWSTMPFGVK